MDNLKYKIGDLLLYKERDAIYEIIQIKFIGKYKENLFICKPLCNDNRDFVSYYAYRINRDCIKIGNISDVNKLDIINLLYGMKKNA